MKLRKLTTGMVLPIVVLIALFSGGWSKTEQANKIPWEYKHLELGSSRIFECQKVLDQQGGEGWELTAVEREQPGGVVHFYFKRPR